MFPHLQNMNKWTVSFTNPLEIRDWKELDKICAITFLHWTFLFSLIRNIFHSQVIMWYDLEGSTDWACLQDIAQRHNIRYQLVKEKVASKGVSTTERCTLFTKKHGNIPPTFSWESLLEMIRVQPGRLYSAWTFFPLLLKNETPCSASSHWDAQHLGRTWP